MGKDHVEKMDDETFQEAIAPLEEKYYKEIENNGLKRFEIREY